MFVDGPARDGAFDPASGDLPLAGYRVEAVDAAAPGVPVASTVTGRDGRYALEGLAPGRYRLRVLSPTGVELAESPPVDLTSGGAARDLRVDPTGRVYDAVTGAPVAGVRVRVEYDGGGLVPATAMGLGQQGQVTAGDGIYRVDLPPGRYRLALDTSQVAYAAPSLRIPPRPGFAPAGPVVTSPLPEVDGDTTYYLQFDLQRPGDAVFNNHIPVDPLAARVVLTKRADRPAAAPGDVVAYTIAVANRTSRDLRGASVLDTPAQGLAVVRDSARAAIAGRPVAAAVRFDGGRSRRIARFGPFDLPAGATLELTYHAVVGSDVRPGDLDNRAAMVDAAGVRLSTVSVARVRVAADPDFDEGLAVGRVFCDDDGDGLPSAGERGVFGARVYIDTGSYARTDADGRFHLSQIRPGVHVVKLDADSLAGGTPRGDPARPIHFTAGLPARVDLPVRCAGEVVRRGHPAMTVRDAAGRGEPPGRRVTVSGSVRDATVAIDGVPVALPGAAVVPADGRFLLRHGAPPGVAPREWVLAVSRHRPDGSFERTVRQWRGAGAPPPRVDFDGRDDAGAALPPGLYSAQLAVAYAGDDAMAVSRRAPFAIQPDAPPAPPAPEPEVWRGDLFRGGRRPRATAELRRRVAAVVARLRPGDRVAVEVHADGAGDRLAAMARTAREAKLVAELFAAAGVAPDRITARGRGAAELLADPGDAAGRDRNRRVVVAIVPAARPTARPAAHVDVPKALLDGRDARATVAGQPVPIDADGRFEVVAELPACVEVGAADGRLSMLCIQRPPDGPPARELAIRGDLTTGTVVIGGREVEPQLFAVDLAITRAAGGLDLAPRIPARLPVAAWRVVIRAADGAVIRDARHPGPPPPVIEWDARPLVAGRSYTAELWVEVANGVVAASPRRPFVYDPPPAVEDLPALAIRGRLFRSRGRRLRARFANHLSRIVAALAPDERIALSLQVAVPADAPISEQRLAVAVRARAVRRYLDRLGLPADRYRLDAAPARDRGDALRVGRLGARPPPPAAPAAAPSLVVAGQPIATDGSAIDARVTVPAGEDVTVEIALASGARAHLTVPPPPRAARPASVADDAPATGAATEPAAWADAADVAIELPPAGTTLRARALPVRGRVHPGNRLTIDGRAIDVAADGRFAAIVELPAGAHTLRIESTDRDGYVAEIEWPVRVAASATFVLGLAEAAAVAGYDSLRGASADDAWIDGMTDATTIAIGPVRLHGRAALYVVSRLRDVRVTAHVDTARRAAGAPLGEQVIDPARGWATFGDDAAEVRDAQARGPIYLRVEDGRGGSATVGNIRTGVRGGDLLRFSRTVYGAEVDVDAVSVGAHTVSARAFTAFDTAGLSRAIDLFRATGGSLYYLRHAHVAEGSERVRIVVRDRDSGLIAGERVAVRDVDYTIDYPSGRVLFHSPIASVADSGWLLDNLDRGASPLDGHPVYVEVTYEHEDGGAGGPPAGAYVRDRIGDVAIGAGVVTEGRDGDAYMLWGADAQWSVGPHSRVRAEVGASRAADASNAVSSDGGLTFAPAGTATAAYNLAWKVAAEFAVGAATTARLHAQQIDSGFSSGATLLEQGRTKLGGEVVRRMGDGALAVRHETDVGAVDDRTSARTAAQWSRRHGPWRFAVEFGHHYVDGAGAHDANRAGIGARAARRLSEHVTLRAGQEVQVALSGDDPQLRGVADGAVATAGADIEVAPGVVVSADEAVRFNGDNATRVGLTAPLGDGGSMYVRQQIGAAGDGGATAATIVGASDRAGRSGRSYGEYRVEDGPLGRRNRAVFGLGHGWRVARGVQIGLGYEHQQVFGGFSPDGAPVGDQRRDVASARAAITRWRGVVAGARAELRWDEGDTVDRVQLVAGAGATAAVTREITALARIRLLRTVDASNQKLPYQPEHLPDRFDAADHTHIVAGWAYRPLGAAWLTLFARYAYLIDQRPTDRAGGTPVTTSHAAALAPIVRLPWRLELSGKLAWKKTRLQTPEPAASPVAAPAVTRTDAVLALARLAYRVAGNWEVAGEVRRLYAGRPGRAASARDGTLWEIAYTIAGTLRLGLGYNFSRFSDNELGDLERDAHGPFVRLMAHY